MYEIEKDGIKYLIINITQYFVIRLLHLFVVRYHIKLIFILCKFLTFPLLIISDYNRKLILNSNIVFLFFSDL